MVESPPDAARIPPSAADEQKTESTIESTPSAQEGDRAPAPAAVDVPPAAAAGSGAQGRAAKGQDPQATVGGEREQQEA